MIVPLLPVNDDERVESLRRMQLLGTPDDEAFDRVTRTAQRLFAAPIVMASLLDSDTLWARSCIGLTRRKFTRHMTFCAHAIHSERITVVQDATLDPRFASNPLVLGPPHLRFYAGRPIRNAEGHVLGTLCLFDTVAREFSSRDELALHDLGHWLETVYRAHQLSEVQRQMLAELDRAKHASLIDPLLNAWNRQAVMSILQREYSRLQRSDGALAVLMCDFDHFKTINDHFGHAGGDAVLVDCCQRIRRVLRAHDSLGRYGGEELLIVLPDTEQEEARQIAARVCAEVGAETVAFDGQHIAATMSIGVGSCRPGGDHRQLDDLLAAADRAMYRAKAAGRNRVE
ncbi:GGDEF domain-containing protein [Paludibacterium yongneupense]|uniref:GGDEF domain-containing protein n=1 Tax=Paludibacterium yongneupense TaxID=400061 RepID=UPI0003FE9E8D|nr:sensor domain-containing diguanylate cyclase [Paludibacterium yongneupense]